MSKIIISQKSYQISSLNFGYPIVCSHPGLGTVPGPIATFSPKDRNIMYVFIISGAEEDANMSVELDCTNQDAYFNLGYVLLFLLMSSLSFFCFCGVVVICLPVARTCKTFRWLNPPQRNKVDFRNL